MDIIANPHSGKDNGASVLQQVKSYLDGRNIPCTIHLTQEAGHAKQLAQKLCSSGAKTVVALGGDGTFHEVLNGMDFSRSRMGLIPAGRGNDYAEGTGVDLDPLQAAAAIVSGVPADYDYIQVDSVRCLNVGGTGLDVSVLQHTAHKNNKISYTGSLVHCLLHYKPYTIEIECNGETSQHSCVMVGVCNGTQFGGGIKLCPPARHDDGKMDLIIIEKPVGIPTILVMPGFVKGHHMNKSYVRHILCDSARITTPAPIQLDGEIYHNLKFDASIVAGGFKTFAPTK